MRAREIGEMYDMALGVPHDGVKASGLYLKAAEKGHTAAQYSLGRMYRFGLGVAKDDVEAEKWFREASKHRCIASKVLLSAMEREKSARNEYAKDEEEIQRRHKL